MSHLVDVDREHEAEREPQAPRRPVDADDERHREERAGFREAEEQELALRRERDEQELELPEQEAGGARAAEPLPRPVCGAGPARRRSPARLQRVRSLAPVASCLTRSGTRSTASRHASSSAVDVAGSSRGLSLACRSASAPPREPAGGTTGRRGVGGEVGAARRTASASRPAAASTVMWSVIGAPAQARAGR